MRFEKAVMGRVWVARALGEFRLAGRVFFVVATNKSGGHLLSDSAGEVSMFFSVVNWTFLSKKKTPKKLGRVSRSACVFHVKTLGLLPKQLKTYPLPFKEKKKSHSCCFLCNSLDKNLIVKVGLCFFLTLLVLGMRILVTCFLWICCSNYHCASEVTH